MQEKNLMI